MVEAIKGRRDAGASDLAAGGITRTKLWSVISVAVVLIASLYQLGRFSVETQHGIRGFVGAEGLWSKHQKDMIHDLLMLLETGDPSHVAHYRGHLQALRAAMRVRIELEKPDPDMAVVADGFAALGVVGADVDSMAKLFRRFRSVDYVDRAVQIWTEGDQKIEALSTFSERALEDLEGRELSADERAGVAERLEQMDDQLRKLEDDFSATLGAAGRWADGLLALLTALLSLLAVALCGLIGWFGARALGRDEQRAAALRAEGEIKEGQADVGAALSGELTERKVASRAIRRLARRAGADLGALYVADEEGTLRIAGSYAFPRDEAASRSFEPGVGLVGQAALDQEPLLLDELPDGYVTVRSGTGESPPTHLLIYPLVLADEVRGVIELAATHPLDEQTPKLCRAVEESVCRALLAARARQKVEVLLARSQELNEELQAQQEELRQANDELAEQSRALEESQERLELQQRDLEETNANLEERTETLERQQRAIEAQNAELEEAREAIAEKARALEETSRYKSEFLANMSHELRTPLNSIIILSGLLAENREHTLSDKQTEYARTIHDSGNELLELINELLDLSKIEAGKMTLLVDDVDLDALLTSVTRQFSALAAGRQLHFTAERAKVVPPRIRSDGQRLGQIVKNLLSNAFKFTHEGRVRLTIDRPSEADLELVDLELPPTELLAITVEDTGIGIPKEKQRLIFQAFQQADGSTDRKYGGTGLGLAITREFARLLGGRIVMQSQPGRGSRFTVVLPESAMADPEGSARLVSVPPMSGPTRVSRPARQAAPEAALVIIPEPAPAISLGPPDGLADDRDSIGEGDRSILIIEDDPRFARTLADLSRERGFKVLLAPDGPTGLALAQRFVPSAILLDLGLPGVDGMTVMTQLKDDLTTRHIPVHVISGLGKKLETLKAGALGFLHKPVSMVQLDTAFGRIETLLAKPVKDLLVVVGDEQESRAVVELITEKDVQIVTATTAEQALSELSQRSFDCVVIDLKLPDAEGPELLTRVRRSDGFSDTPVIALADGVLSREDQLLLDRYADRVVQKGEKLPERLLDETALFLHRVERDLPLEKRRLIEMLHDKEAILRGRKLLLVDDDMRNVFALSSVLEAKGLEIVVARHGKEALARLEAHSDVDLVLMDIMMPEMDGYEAMRRIRQMERFASLPIIALTAKAMKEDRARCLEAGASDYLSKPVDTDKLLSALRVWLYR